MEAAFRAILAREGFQGQREAEALDFHSSSSSDGDGSGSDDEGETGSRDGGIEDADAGIAASLGRLRPPAAQPHTTTAAPPTTTSSSGGSSHHRGLPGKPAAPPTASLLLRSPLSIPRGGSAPLR